MVNYARLGEGGVRSKSEALWLRWEHVDLEQEFLGIASDHTHPYRMRTYDERIASFDRAAQSATARAKLPEGWRRMWH